MKGQRDEKFDASVNRRVKEVRLALNLTQAEFREKILHSHGHYAEIELCHRPVNKRTISLICTRYGVSEQYLTRGEGPMFDRRADYREDEAAGLFRKLPPEFQEYILRFMQEMIDLDSRKTKQLEQGPLRDTENGV
jgi:transcriptional regulator with XRE-family HTH domain